MEHCPRCTQPLPAKAEQCPACRQKLERDRRGVLLPQRHAVGGIITPQ